MRTGREVPIWKESFIAGVDLTAKQFYAVKYDAAGKMIVGTLANAIGVLQDHSKAESDATVILLGMSKAVAGAAIAVGAEVTSDADGKFVTAAAGQVVLARANLAAAAEDDIFEVLLLGPYQKNA